MQRIRTTGLLPKGFTRVVSFGVALILSVAFLAGCGSSPGSGSSEAGSAPIITDSANDNRAPVVTSPDADTVLAGETTGTGAGAATESRKVIFSYDYNLETTDMNSTILALESAVQASGGYIEGSDYNGRAANEQYSYATLTCRIPVDAANQFKAAIEQAGHVYSKSEQGQDITDQYFDTEARLEVLRAQEERLLTLLEQSGDLSDLLEIERELARVRTEIESLTGTLEKYDNLVDLTTFTISVRNVSEYSPIVEESFGSELRRAVNDSLRIFVEVAQRVLISLVYLLPYLLVIGVVLLIVLVVARLRRKSKPPQGPAANPPAPPMQGSQPTPGSPVSPQPPVSSVGSRPLQPPVGSPQPPAPAGSSPQPPAGSGQASPPAGEPPEQS